MKKKNNLKTFSKKEAQKIIVIIKKDLNKKELLESEKQLLLKFKKYLKQIKLECLIISKTNIKHSIGKRIENYINYKISNYLSSCINNDNLCSIRSSNLEIIDKKYIKGTYHYRTINHRNKNVGALIFISPKDAILEQNKFIFKF